MATKENANNNVNAKPVEEKDKDEKKDIKEREKDKEKKRLSGLLAGFANKKGMPLDGIAKNMEQDHPSASPIRRVSARRRTLSKSRRERPTSALDRSHELPHLYQLLADNKLNESEIWEGDPGLFPVIYQFKEQFEKMEPINSVVTVTLPALPEFGGHSSRCYKINSDLTSYEAVSLICKKLGVTSPHHYCLSTLRHFIMADNEPLFMFSVITTKESKWQFVLYPNATLADYGFGSRIFKWELDLVFSALLPYFITYHTYKPAYGWCQVEQIPLEILPARLIIASLEPIAANAAKLQKEMGFMKNLLTATQKDLRTTRAQFADTSASLVGANSRVSELEGQIEEANQANRALEKQYSDTHERLVLLQQENATLDTFLATQTSDLSNVRAQLTSSQSDLSASQKQEIASKAVIAEKEALVTFIKSELAAVQADLDQKVIKIEELSTAFTSSYNKQAQLQEELEQLQINYDEKERYLGITKEELTAVQEELRAIKEIYHGKLDYATATTSYAEERATKVEAQLRETERKAAEIETNYRREIETLKKEMSGQRRAFEEKAKQEQETATRLIERKYNVTINELKADLQKAMEKDITINELKNTIATLEETQGTLNNTIQDWISKSVEWETTKKEMQKNLASKDILDSRLAQANNTIAQLTKTKEEEEKRTKNVTLISERQRIELAAEKERSRMLGEQLRNMVHNVESTGRSSDIAKNSAKLLEEVLANKAAPPPPPSPPVGGPPIHIKGKNNPAVDAASRADSRRTLSANDFLVKRGDLKPVAKPAPRQGLFGSRANVGATPPAGAPVTLADVLFASMQKRFQQINRDDVEELDVEVDEEELDNSESEEEEIDEWRVF